MTTQPTDKAKPKIYVFCNQKGCTGKGDWHSFIAVAEDGNALCGHVCSHHGFAYGDMGVREDGFKRDIYAKHYPQGFEVIMLEGQEEIDKVLKTLPEPKEESANV